MNRRGPASRGAFSLLEVMIATAILAGSAMVLFSLIQFGTRLGSRSETRIHTLVQAQSILDESIARLSAGDSQSNLSGEIDGATPRSYRVTVEPIGWLEESEGDWNKPELPQLASDKPSSQVGRPRELVAITVELFEGSKASSSNTESLVTLSRWIRVIPSRSEVSR
jgi:type II secretory pathway pseudopilin PulG